MRTSIFDTIAGLPVHPLIDHVVVVFVPVFALLQIATILEPKLHEKYSRVVVGGLIIAFGAAVVAKESGEALAIRVGMPGEHAEAGESVVTVMAALLVSAVVWFIFNDRPKLFAGLRAKTFNLVKYATLVLSVAALVVTYQAGHSGAKATWGSRVAEQLPVDGATPSASGSAAGTGVKKTLTTSEVALHTSATDCWSIVNGKVYNLTSYVNSHPGGAANIKNICGKDGSSAFANQHGTASTPNNVLSNYLLGPVGATVANIVPQSTGTSSGGTSGGSEGENEEGDDD
jgi:cytochrome b involved in lipid metabolism